MHLLAYWRNKAYHMQQKRVTPLKKGENVKKKVPPFKKKIPDSS